MPKKDKWEKDSGLAPIEDLFNAITDGNLEAVESAIKRGANMRIKMYGMYPIQRAMLADAMVEKLDPRKIHIGKILTIIEEKSKQQGLVYEGQNLIDKKNRAKQEQFVKKMITSSKKQDPRTR